MTAASCIYEGSVVHHRSHPVEHRFRYRLFMLYLDLDELPRLFAGRLLWSASHPALAWFRRADHLGDPAAPLAEAVRDLVCTATGRRPQGPVRLLTHPRYLGIGFNPISLYYCHERDGGPPVAAVVEVSNTPWGEMHSYVVELGSTEVARGRFGKAMHVSPFLPMDIEYRWAISAPSLELSVGLDCVRAERTVLSAGLSMRRTELSAAALRRVLLRYPPMCAVVLGGIYWQALRLWAKRIPYHPHPRHHALGVAPAQPPAPALHREVA